MRLRRVEFASLLAHTQFTVESLLRLLRVLLAEGAAWFKLQRGIFRRVVCVDIYLVVAECAIIEAELVDGVVTNCFSF